VLFLHGISLFDSLWWSPRRVGLVSVILQFPPKAYTERGSGSAVDRRNKAASLSTVRNCYIIINTLSRPSSLLSFTRMMAHVGRVHGGISRRIAIHGKRFCASEPAARLRLA
jgi:hypothetical protein